MQVSSKSPSFASSRGARFLDLVRQNKLNVSPQLSKVRLSLVETEKLKNGGSEKENKEKDYLKFNSSSPFNPEASPSSSILSKRKAEADSSPLTSSAKRKRVGFRDPVSSTKEYLITEEEEKQKQSSLIRCLNYENAELDDEELAKEEINIKQEIKIVKEEETIPEPELLDHDYDDHSALGSPPQNTDISTSSENSEKISFKNKSELMAYISNNLSVDEIFEQLTKAEEASVKRKELIGKVVKTVGFEDFLGEYFTIPHDQATKLTPDQNEVITAVLAELSTLMTTNDNVKHKVLDVLSEKHSREFLDHALQENSTARVCDKLTMPSIVNYIVHKVNTVEETPESDINRMNRVILQKLITSTNSVGREVLADRHETQEMMKLLFRNKPKIDIFDTVHEFLRNIVQNH